MQCPYDGTPIDREMYSGGFVVVSCPRCGAQWELHNALIHRIREPDRAEVVKAHLEQHDGASPEAIEILSELAIQLEDSIQLTDATDDV